MRNTQDRFIDNINIECVLENAIIVNSDTQTHVQKIVVHLKFLFVQFKSHQL